MSEDDPAEAVEVSVAKAVVSQLAAASLSRAFTPIRSWADWVRPLEDDDKCEEDKLYVDVVPVATAQEIEASSRATLAYTCPIDIAVRRKFSPKFQDQDTLRINVREVDALMFLVQEIHELFTLARMQDFEAGTWMETRRLVAPHKAHLRDWRQFTGIVRVTFRADRKLV
jgi:hypothetical protein